MHLFGHTCDHDYYFELLSEEEQDAQSVTLINLPSRFSKSVIA